MLRPLALILLAAAAIVGLARPAAAERLITSLSEHRVMVTPSFNGREVVLFGGIEREAGALSPRGGYDIAVTVIGPRQTVVTFRKERMLGIWVNYESRVFENAPSYLAVLTNRPLDAITNADTLRRLQLGLDNIALPQRIDPVAGDDLPGDVFRKAFLSLKDEHGLYRQESNGVTFVAPALFRASIPLPAEVLVGTYEVDVKLFADGAVIARTPSALEIFKAGFEQFVTTSAQNHGLLYGLAAASMAILTGWFASVVFRRD
ncbi:MAG TPA: TIGR02186 family protein [Xanthobacteraceae bacterium]